MGRIISKLSKKDESIILQRSQTEFRYVDGRRFHNVKDVVYSLPNDEEESDRLHLQHFLLRYVWQNNFSAPIEHILSKPGSKVLDVGCGAASWSFDMATAYPLTNIIGLDISPHQPTQIKPKNFTFVKANVLEGLPFEDDTFDFIFQRFLVFGYSKEKWPYVINELVRVLKPGGFLELNEFSNQFDTGPSNQRLWFTIVKMFEERGVDLNTCQKLEEYTQNQGQLENIIKEVKQCYHGVRSNDIKISKVAISNTTSLYSSLKLPLTKALNISDDEFDELVKASKDELFEFDTYYNLVRVYARKINNSNNE
ncbi:S-adenosyl-L-methionine-dependent methyltransferase [Gigaspora margarita]|uniref:S-adenosyl-L-methionine-dependent methyltransferase n=1 Tax=Gigaspora margarita TaxID=4874 RepID=A0A8H4AX54_GIGMA|nr:S-adenosyl-L-methionine-dependent methyltransferase [Gigaspora margarita]